MVELRVHGIGGTSAESMLGRASDDTTIPVWRGDPGGRSSVRRATGEHDVLAYHWAPLTSGSRWFALWPVLLPFTLVNAAGWMHPGGRTAGGRARVRVVRTVVRLLGLVLTCAAVVWTALASIAVAGGLLDGRSPTTRFVAAIAVTTLVVAAILLASAVSVPGFEAFDPPWCASTDGRAGEDRRPNEGDRAGDGPGVGDAPATSPLADPCFFRRRTGGVRGWWVWWWAHTVVAVGSVVVVVVFSVRAGLEDPFGWLGRVVLLLTTVQVAGFGVLLAASVRRPLGWGLAGPAAALFGSVVIGGVALAAIVVLTSLDHVPSGPAGMLFDVYGWASIAAAVAAVVLAVAYLVVPLRLEREADDADDLTETERRGRRAVHDRLLGSNRAALQARLARFPGALPVAGGVFAITFAVLAVVAMGVRFLGDEPADGFRLTDDLPITVARITFWGLVAYMVLGLVRSRADPASLRRVGNVWDVLCFWPRTIHPFAVRPYSERAIPELQRFVAERAARGHIVLTAHSQGTVLAYAALAPLAHDHAALRSRIALVTFGSPLRTIYVPAFPHYFRAGDFVALRAALGDRWTNVFRYTDHVGRTVFADSIAVSEIPLVDAAGPDRPVPDPAPGGHGVAAHSGYWDEPTIRTAVRDAFGADGEGREARDG